MTKKLIKFFYMAGMEISTVCILCALADDFNLEPGRHLANMIFAPVLAVVLVGFVRVQSEIVRALSRTTEYTRTVAANLKGAGRLSFQMDLANIDFAKPTIGNRIGCLPSATPGHQRAIDSDTVPEPGNNRPGTLFPQTQARLH
ncbi:MAG TPA: DUF4282 domain-containing protein [Myxococcales bacterium]|nr:DUF4282 domain-containing protein [Myxococcales bacterium]